MPTSPANLEKTVANCKEAILTVVPIVEDLQDAIALLRPALAAIAALQKEVAALRSEVAMVHDLRTEVTSLKTKLAAYESQTVANTARLGTVDKIATRMTRMESALEAYAHDAQIVQDQLLIVHTALETCAPQQRHLRDFVGSTQLGYTPKPPAKFGGKAKSRLQPKAKARPSVALASASTSMLPASTGSPRKSDSPKKGRRVQFCNDEARGRTPGVPPGWSGKIINGRPYDSSGSRTRWPSPGRDIETGPRLLYWHVQDIGRALKRWRRG